MIEDPWFLAVLIAALLAVGAFAGLLAGLLGVGGGIVIVPALYHLFGFLGVDDAIRMHLAVGTSLATIIPTSLSSLRSHLRRDAVDVALLRSWGPAIAFGVVAGAALMSVAKGTALALVFASVALVVAVHMAAGTETLRVSDRLPAGPVRAVIGVMIGLVSTMMGIGGGTLTVPTLVLCNYPIRRAVGTAAAIGLIIAVPGTIGAIIGGWDLAGVPPLSLGYVSLLGFAFIVPATVLMAPVGARIAHTINTRLLRRLFALFLGLTSARMFYDVLV